MPNVEQFVMVTKNQYTRLLDGETVNGHTYDDSVIYLVEEYDDPQAKTVIEERVMVDDIYVDGRNKFLRITVKPEAQDRCIIFAPNANSQEAYEWGYEKGFKTTLFIQGLENIDSFTFQEFFLVSVDNDGPEHHTPYFHPFTLVNARDGSQAPTFTNASGYTTVACDTQGPLSLGPVDMTVSLLTDTPTIYFHGPVILREEQG